jgi:hypothetical protein
MVRWVPAGTVLVPVLYLAMDRMGMNPGWKAAPALLLPPLAAGLTVLFSRSGVLRALSWLDNAVGGQQELQAAWELRDSAAPLSPLIRDTGERILRELQPLPPVPGPGKMQMLLAAVSGVLLFIAAAAGLAFMGPPDPAVTERGAEMETWAESWAERSMGSGGLESRDLAERMGKLGRRMADGNMSEGRAEHALKRLEEEIQEKHDDLVRDRLAETLVNDLGISRESAEMFRVQRRRLSADVLAEIGSSLGAGTALPEMNRKALESLLSNPAFRDSAGRGRPELTEKLTQALKDSLNENDSRLKDLEEAASRSRRARGRDQDSGSQSGDKGENSAENTPGGSGSADSSGGKAGEEDPPERTRGRSAGGGRGSAEVKDEPSDGAPLYPSTADEPMRLPSLTDRTGSWRTVIRAFTEDRRASPTPEGTISSQWNAEVESVIAREDIPPGVRDYVRDYFLALEEGPANSGDEE